MDNFKSRGFTDPINLIDSSRIDEILNRFSAIPEKLLPWWKGRHSLDPAMYDLGSHPIIVEEVSKILGDDLLLWSSQLKYLKPNEIDHWHTNAEMAKWPGVTVWIGMKNSLKNRFKIISGSHLLGLTPEELLAKEGVDFNNEIKVLEAAKNINPSCEVINFDIKEGQFIVYNGLSWHSTQNVTDTVETAVILQYTTPKYRIFIPQNKQYPITRYSLLQPDCLLVKGEDKYKFNRIIDRSYAGSWKAMLKTLLVHLPNKLCKKY